MSQAVGSYLATHRLRHGDQRWLAEQLGVSSRALRNWRARAAAQGPKRAAHAPRGSISAATESRARELWRALLPGHDGRRTLVCELVRAGIALTRGMVRWLEGLVAQLKRERAQRKRERFARERLHTHVLARDVMWSCDESLLGRDQHGDEVRGLFVREVFSQRTYTLSVGAPVKGDELVAALEALARERGGWPLVLALDNGGANRCEQLERVLAEHQVIALFNVPRTPQHNAFGERAIGEGKQASGVVEIARRWASRLMRRTLCALLQRVLRDTERRLERTPRHARAGRTPLEIDRSAPRADHRVCRARFYEDVCAALASVELQQLKPRARRRAVREAIFSSLVQHGLVVRTRGGGQSSRPSKRNSVA